MGLAQAQFLLMPKRKRGSEREVNSLIDSTDLDRKIRSEGQSGRHLYLKKQTEWKEGERERGGREGKQKVLGIWVQNLSKRSQGNSLLVASL